MDSRGQGEGRILRIMFGISSLGSCPWELRHGLEMPPAKRRLGEPMGCVLPLPETQCFLKLLPGSSQASSSLQPGRVISL